MTITRLLQANDAKFMYEWMQDPEITEFLSFDPSDKTLHDAQLFIENALLTNNQNKHFAIQDDKGVYVGTISLKNIDHVTESAEYAIVIRKKYHGQGYAKKASEWLLKEAVSRFKLKNIYLTVINYNETAIFLYEKMGFIRDNNKDSVLLKNGKEFIQYYYMKRLVK